MIHCGIQIQEVFTPNKPVLYALEWYGIGFTWYVGVWDSLSRISSAHMIWQMGHGYQIFRVKISCLVSQFLSRDFREILEVGEDCCSYMYDCFRYDIYD